MKFKSWAAGWIVAVLLLPFAAVTGRVPAANAADWVVGANIGNVPWEFQDAKGQLVGFELDLIREIARRQHRGLDIQNIPFNGLFTAVQSGRIQIALSSITVTPKRLQSLAFTQPYYDADQSLCVARTSRVARLEDLAGKTVGVDTASTGDIYASSNQARLGIASIARYEGLVPAMLDLASGRIDGYLSDIPAVAWYIRDKPQFRIALRIPTGEHYSMMFTRGFADADAINATLSAMKQDGYMARLHQTWFGTAAASDASTVRVMDRPRP